MHIAGVEAFDHLGQLGPVFPHPTDLLRVHLYAACGPELCILRDEALAVGAYPGVAVSNSGRATTRLLVSAQVRGNPHGNRHRTRHLLNQEFMQALLLNFRHQGKKVIEKVARNQPAAYLKILALLVPRELKLEHSGGVKAMSDEQIEQAIEAIQIMLAARAGEAAKVIEGTAEPAALPAPEASIGAGLEPKSQRRPNRLMMQADTAVGPRERKPRKVPSPAST
jgi:hypothetical protein